MKLVDDYKVAENSIESPWPDVATARLFLQRLTVVAETAVPPVLQHVDEQKLAAWLLHHEIAPRAVGAWQAVWPTLTNRLRADMFAVTAENQLHLFNLQSMATAVVALSPPLLLLKGMALVASVYNHLGQRPMSDLDVWLLPDDLARALLLLTQHGFILGEKDDRPLALQQMAGGEVALTRPDWHHSLVELHWSPVPGWWLSRVAQVDEAGMWARKVPLAVDGVDTAVPLYRLGNEDMVLQVAVHMAVNHQVGMAAMRSLLDVALMAVKWDMDWRLLVQRARSWRVATAVYQVLALVAVVYGVAEVAEAVEALRPSRLRRWLLARLVTPERMLAGEDLRNGRRRYLFLLLLVDRPVDMVKLVWRTLWPEDAWLVARYGTVRRGHHLWQVLRYGRI